MTEPRTCTICGVIIIKRQNSSYKTCGAEACKKQHYIDYKARYYAEHRDAILERGRRYREENPDAELEKHRRYYAKYRDAILGYNRRYRIENPDAMRERDRCYQVENRDAILEYSRRYRAKNPDPVKERNHRGYLRRTMAQEIVRSFGVTLIGDYKARRKQALDILHEFGITNQEIDQWIAQAQTQDDTNNNVAGRDLSSTRDSLSLTAKPTI